MSFTRPASSPNPVLPADAYRHCTPQLPVADVAKTQAYYRDVLGFAVLWIWIGHGEGKAG